MSKDSSKCSPTPPPPFCGPIRLEIRGLGHVPAMKNKKFIGRKKDGKPFIMTAPERKQWMERAAKSFVSQLLSGTQTTSAGMQIMQSRLYLILCSLPDDDCWQCVPQIHVKAIKVPKGEEGANIIIERL